MSWKWFRLLFSTQEPSILEVAPPSVVAPSVKHYSTPRHKGQHARDFCPICGQFVAVTNKGFWKHSCTPREDGQQ
jgi:hypothetical protein